MTDREVWRDAVVSQRYTGPERRHAPEDPPISIGRFLVLFAVAAVMWAAIGAAWIWALTR